jgi:hypothetical protein
MSRPAAGQPAPRPQAPAPRPQQAAQAPAGGSRSGASSFSQAEWDAQAALNRAGGPGSGAGVPRPAAPTQGGAGRDVARDRFRRARQRQQSPQAAQARNQAHWQQQRQQQAGTAVPRGTEAVNQAAGPGSVTPRKPLLGWRGKAALGTLAVGVPATYLGGKALGAADTFLHQQPGGAYQYGMGSPSHFMNPQQM